jgi:tRNA dimethylallyltransferase
MRTNKAIILLGPTASGKTALSLKIATFLKAQIINLDSVQIYKELNIGSAKPSSLELASVPHYLINIESISNPLSSYDVFLKVNQIIREQKEKSPLIITGGTGLYYKNLLYGMFEGPGASPLIRKRLKTIAPEKLYEKLTLIDPDAAKKIHPNDYHRIERALEVFYTSGQKMSELQKAFHYKPPIEFLLIGLTYERSLLYERINKRVDKMVEQGLIKEAQTLFERYPDNRLLQKTIGYKELIRYFNKELSLDTAIEEIKKNSRHFAKRQLTLFRHIEGVKWFCSTQYDEIKEYINFAL